MMKVCKRTFLVFLLFWSVTAPARSSKVNVTVDDRMEFLTVIQYLSGYPILTQAELNYKKEVEEHFRDYRDHPAVVLNKSIYERFFGFDAAPSYLYHFSFPGFRQTSGFSEDELRTFEYDKHSDTLSLLLATFKDFYKRTGFHKFYSAHEGFYDSLKKPIQAKLDESRIIEILEDHYGKENKEYNVVLVPLLHDGGYGPAVRKGNGQAIYAIIGPRSDSKDMPVFDVKTILSEYVIHEFSHSFCNPLIAKGLPELRKDSCLFTPIKDAMAQHGYGTWEACLYEHFVRANEILITEKVLNRSKAADLMDNMIRDDKWIYLRGLIDVMRKYQEDRKTYKTIDDIMPLVVTYFHEEAAKCN
jgi:hypothetical protein